MRRSGNRALLRVGDGLLIAVAGTWAGIVACPGVAVSGRYGVAFGRAGRLADQPDHQDKRDHAQHADC
jgi:hypothetical protein